MVLKIIFTENNTAHRSNTYYNHLIKYAKNTRSLKLRTYIQGRRSGYESGGDGIHVNPEGSFGGTNGEPPSEASQLRKGGPGVLPRKMSKTYMANGAIYVIPELYL